MTPIVIECEQNTESWLRHRLGLPTASMFSTVMASGKAGAASKTRATYMRKLAGEIITGEPSESYQNSAMERGHVMEAEARNYYALMENVEPRQVGFVRNDIAGCSPDALIGDHGVLEIKTAQPNVFIEHFERYYREQKCPPEHVAQLQGNLWVTQRQWIDLVIYWPKMPHFVIRCERNEPYIDNIAYEVKRFADELSALVEWVRLSVGGEKAA